jgi:carbonic anhydrase
MEFLQKLLERNRQWAASFRNGHLTMRPSESTVIITCLDCRVDPFDLFQLRPGEAAVIRNIGGRVSKYCLDTIATLQNVGPPNPNPPSTHYLILHHLDCGIINIYNRAPDTLAKHLGVSLDELDDLAITDPYRAVTIDTEAIQGCLALPAYFTVSGHVYDVKTGSVSTVVEPVLLRSRG